MQSQRIEDMYQWLQSESDYRENGAPDMKMLAEACSELRFDLLAGGQAELVDYMNAQAPFYAGTIRYFSKEEQKRKRCIRDEESRKYSAEERNKIAWEVARYYCMEEEYEEVLQRKEEAGCEDTVRKLAALAQMGHYKSGLQLASFLSYTDRQAEAGQLLQGLIRQRPNPDAYAMLGDLYSIGKGVGRNPDKACECFERAAQMGHAGAMKAAADMNYRAGLIRKPVFRKASEWYHKAADFGDRESMYLAGVCDLLCESAGSRQADRTEEEDLHFWQSGKELLARSGDKRAKALLGYADRRLPRRKSIPVMTVRELYERLREEEKKQKYLYRGQVEMYKPPLRPSAFRYCQYSRFAVEGNPADQIRKWGREFYLEYADCEYLFGDEKVKKSHAVRRMMSVYMNNALGYPLTQALFQQAGYSSEGLDVSYDLHIALFFALYRFKNGRYYRKTAGDKPSVLYRWKLPEKGLTLQDDYYSKTYFIPSLEILKSFAACKDRAESSASLERYLKEIGWGSMQFELPEKRPFECIKIPEESLTGSRIALQKGALLIPDIIPGRGMLETHGRWGYPIKDDTDLEYNLVQDLSDPSVCDSFMIDCSNLGDSDFDVLEGLPSPDEIYSENQNDISHILTYNIFERAYEETMRLYSVPVEFTPIMPAYGVSYLDALAQLKEWNRQKKKGQYFYVFQ